MSDPATTSTDQTIGLILCCIFLLGIPLALWIGTRWDETRRRLDSILATVQHPPTHDATTYPVCHAHGQRIPNGGTCAICVLDLHADLKALERGEL